MFVNNMSTFLLSRGNLFAKPPAVPRSMLLSVLDGLSLRIMYCLAVLHTVFFGSNDLYSKD
jgi:hypothetical protein